MSMTANLHRIKKVEHMHSNATHWLDLTDDRGNTVSVFMPGHVASAMADAWNSAMSDEPDPLDPETIAARKGAEEQSIIDAGRGHLIGGAQ